MTATESSNIPERTAYQGVPGAFSHEASLVLRPGAEPVGFETFDAAIGAVLSGACSHAVIPLENSTIGVIEPAASLVAAAGLETVGEAWRPIRLALMAIPGATLEGIRTVESHKAALGQCRDTIAALNLTPHAVFDTAGAARLVAEAGDPARAAAAPPGAAQLYGLSILRHDIQDSAGNQTRFVLLKRVRA